MGGDSAGYARAERVQSFEFPRDHGAHPDFRTEWWYLTGNVTDRNGRKFGFQWTLFRNALTPEEVSRSAETSAFRTRQLWMGHLGLTDVGAGVHHGFERWSREALGLAGAEVTPVVRVWLEDWSLTARSPGVMFPAQLLAAEGDVALDLWLSNNKPFVLQGEKGLSRKGAEPGNASYYYSCTRLSAGGKITIAGEEFQVRGNAWLDREWSTSALGEGVVGWDWFALQLTPLRELMVYRLRREDGTTDPFSKGVFVGKDGETTHLNADEFELVPTRWWTTADGRRYPVDWTVKAPSLDLDLAVEALIPDQEMAMTVRYWEGAVLVSGTAQGKAADGRGYLEMTSYD